MRKKHLEIELEQEKLWLLPEKAIFFPAHGTLLVSDLHLGKGGHFRKHGIAIPGEVHKQDLQRLKGLIDDYQPSRLVFLGDLFHSRYNQEWESFQQLMDGYKLEKILVQGNHDVLGEDRYQKAQLQVVEASYKLGRFVLQHEPSEAGIDTTHGYELAGHLHPGVRLQGPGRQKLRLPCFYFAPSHGVLPAFGQFTGLYCLEPSEGDRVYVVVNDQVVGVHPSPRS